MESRRLTAFFYVLLRKQLTYDEIKDAIDKACAYEQNKPSMVLPTEHPIYKLAETFAARVQDPPVRKEPVNDVLGDDDDECRGNSVSSHSPATTRPTTGTHRVRR